jgi:uncharacterized protein (TIGR03790 family)
MYGVPLAIRSLESEDAKQLSQDEKMDTRAAVDSELALVLTDDYSLEGWLPNPYFLGFREQSTLLKRDAVLMVSRLDGPAPATVRRLVDDALLAEKEGLQGRAYFDARWPKPADNKLEGYALYDASLHAATENLRKSGRMEVRLDERNELFQPGDCPKAALYCGWYSLGRYVDAFDWVRGAIGFHIASSECVTLKQKDSPVWCKRMLEDGVAATIGPVYEPYVQGFPLPELFFTALTEGYLSLGESYLISLPFLSWQMVLIGDPLYRPELDAVERSFFPASTVTAAEIVAGQRVEIVVDQPLDPTQTYLMRPPLMPATEAADSELHGVPRLHLRFDGLDPAEEPASLRMTWDLGDGVWRFAAESSCSRRRVSATILDYERIECVPTSVEVCRAADCVAEASATVDGVTASIGVILVDHLEDGRSYTLTATTFHFEPGSAIAGELAAAGPVPVRIELLLGHRPYAP